MVFQNLAGGLESIQCGHVNVHHDDIRIKFGVLDNGLVTVFALTANFPGLSRLNHLPECTSYHVVIINNQYSRHPPIHLLGSLTSESGE
jgi:hypothetical protein